MNQLFIGPLLCIKMIMLSLEMRKEGANIQMYFYFMYHRYHYQRSCMVPSGFLLRGE